MWLFYNITLHYTGAMDCMNKLEHIKLQYNTKLQTKMHHWATFNAS